MDCQKLSLDPDIMTKARDGDPTAQVALGKAYFNVVYTENNCLNAFKWFSRAAEKGNMEAQFRLADLYALGQGTKQSHMDAHRWYIKAALQGYKKALIRIHNLYEQDKKMRCRGKLSSEEELRKESIYDFPDFRSETKYYRELYEQRLGDHELLLNNSIGYFTEQSKKYQSNNQEDTDVQLNLAFLYQHGYGVKKYTMRALELYTKAAEQGHRDAQYNAAYLYHTNTDIKFNYRHALRWYRASATNGNVAAQNFLAYFYEKGLAIDVNWEGALHWYTKAANAGSSSAQLTLGKLYRKGQSVDQDFLEAAKWYKLSTLQGNNAAKNCLEQLYQSGKVIDTYNIKVISGYTSDFLSKITLCSKLQKDIAILNDLPHIKQLKMLAMHALMTDGSAMYQIGLMYYNGVELPLDKDTGYLWMKRAAMTGLQAAILKIAKMHKEGETVQQDYHTSEVWTRKGAKQKNDKAQYNLGPLYGQGLGVRRDPLEASKWFIKAGDQNNSDAQYQFGLLKYEGEGVRKDKDEAVKWFRKSALQRNPSALYKLGEMYEDGDSVKKNEHRAIEFYERAAYFGSKDAQFKLGQIFEEGKLAEKNLSRAHNHYIMAANSDIPYYQHILAIKYINRVFDDPDYIKAFNLLKKAAENNYFAAKNIFRTPIEPTYAIRSYSNIINMFIFSSTRGSEGIDYNIGYAYEYGLERKNLRFPLGMEKLFHIDFEKALKWYTSAAKKGDRRAQYRLGNIYEEGKGVTKNLDQAFNYYSQAYSNGNADAMYSLGIMYLNGRGTSQDLVKAFYLFMEASNMGHEEAREVLVPSKFSGNLEMLESVANLGIVAIQYQLGEFYKDEDDLKSFKWFTLAADGGMIDAYYKLGMRFEEGKGTHQDYLKAIALYERAIEKDHEEALYRLAGLYLYGEIIEHDYLKAYTLFSRAAKLGHAEAFRLLNEIWDSTLNISETNQEGAFGISSKRITQILQMFRFVAEQGDTDIQYRLGLFYERNEYNQNYPEALKWYRMAANNNHLEAIYHIGLFYENGLGIIQDYNKATQLYNHAKDRGSHDALYRLGVIFHKGYGVEINHSKAISCYKKAATLGNSKSQYTLGRLYESGDLLQNDILKALAWYTKAYLSDNTSIIPELYDLYDFEPYERFFQNKLFQIFSKLEKSYKSDNRDCYTYYGFIYYKLGKMYLYGIGTKRDKAQGLKQFFKAFYNYSYSDAEPFITLEYNQSEFSSEKTFKEMLDTCREIRKFIPSEHQYKLGMLYYNGYSTYTINPFNSKSIKVSTLARKNNSIAIQYFKLASEAHFTDALHQLGIIYLEDNDTDQAMIWFNKALETLDQNICYKKGMEYHSNKRYKISLAYLKKAAENNHVQALKQLSIMYFQGDGVEKNVDEAMVLIEKLLHVMSTDKCYDQGMNFYNGSGVSINYDLSLIYLRKAAKENDGRALAQLGVMYLQGDGVEKNVDEAMTLIEKSLQLMTPYFCYCQGMKFYNGSGVDINYDISLMYLEKAAEKNDEQALAQLGIMYLHGDGVEKNVDKAMGLIEKSLEVMSTFDCYYQGMKLYNGSGVDINYDISLMYLREAGKRNDAYSQARLGYMYINGIGVDKDDEQAKRWYDEVEYEYFRKPALHLGQIYHYDCGGIQNFSKALKYYQKQLRNEHVLYGIDSHIGSAIRGIGLLYEYGDGVNQDYKKALEYYKKSASYQDIGAFYNLGLLYYYGRGVDQSYKDALKWFTRTYKLTFSGSDMHVLILDKKDEHGALGEYTDREYSLQSEDIMYGEAQYYLGLMYKNGYGVAQDSSRSQQYFKASFGSGIKRAKNFIH